MTNGTVHIIVGGQYGSESKGMAVAEITKKNHNITHAVRTGAINAGHTVYYKDKKYPMQQLPVSWVVPGVKLVVGRGAYVYREVLEKEIAWIKEALELENTKDLVLIDSECFLHLHEFVDEEKAVNLHAEIGSTSEGVASAIKRKISRRDGDSLLMRTQDWAKNHPDFTLVDTSKILNDVLDDGKDIILEGTQGTLLDVHFGEHPYTTSRSTTAGAWMVEAGLAPNCTTVTYMIVRTFPIRVAGNSGRFANEIGWVELMSEFNKKLSNNHLAELIPSYLIQELNKAEDEMQELMGIPFKPHEVVLPFMRHRYRNELSDFHSEIFKRNPVLLEKLSPFLEMTTVTKKLRRIARLSLEDLEYASRLNRPDYIILNFINYEFPNLWDKSDDDLTKEDWNKLNEYIGPIERATKSHVLFGSSGKQTIINFR